MREILMDELFYIACIVEESPVASVLRRTLDVTTKHCLP